MDLDRPNNLEPAVARMLGDAWTEPGFCVPNPTTYPYQWLWDSCFHALIWHRLGSGRAVTELESALSRQSLGGFVPHMIYWGRPLDGAEFWGRPMASSITQPPMYGHAVAELARAGVPIGDELVSRSANGLLHLLEDRPRTPAGLVPIFHPWETGCDDSPRWDHWSGSDGFDPERWRTTKGRMVRSLVYDRHGQPVANPQFTCGSVGFNALVAWNALELVDGSAAQLSPQVAARLVETASGLVATIKTRWDDGSATWVDDGPPSGRARTADALLCTLIDDRAEAFDQLIEPEHFGAPFGPRGVHPDEPAYRPDVYWRGPAWPQISYLLTIAARRAGRGGVADRLAEALIGGATTSNLAEYWHPDTGAGLGAVPQTWAGLALVLAD